MPLDALEMPSANLSGLNSCTSLPQISGSWWRNSTGSSIITPGRGTSRRHLHFLVRFPDQQGTRRIQPENFVKNHGHLRLRPSYSGLSLLNRLSTSSLARSCHSGCMPSTIIVHVSSTDVVSIPAK
ncbi:hypothetical protein PR202_ga16565 [Eleusine coracana subsp. coracana]|uniref:Uncharacterized protein n=1 Tax=Eleusine coracana subsp. coracana TaxID=191504 RepID=A0AAV5CN72_ELECO|nr:hypothetical protein PR202_ga16565 [Eleusine coracana subsp. coracana]